MLFRSVMVDAQDNCRVLDWKTNRLLTGETPELFAARLKSVYAAQLQAYAAVLGKQADRKVRDTVLYATATGQSIRI